MEASSDQFQRDLAGLKSFQQTCIVEQQVELKNSTSQNSSRSIFVDPQREIMYQRVVDGSPSSKGSYGGTLPKSGSISFTGERKPRNVEGEGLTISTRIANNTRNVDHSHKPHTSARKPRSVSPINNTKPPRGQSPNVGPNVGHSSPTMNIIRRVPSSGMKMRKNPSELELAKIEVENMRQRLIESHSKAADDAALIQSMEQERSELDTELAHTRDEIETLQENYHVMDEELSRQRQLCEGLRCDVEAKSVEISDLNLRLQQNEEEKEAIKNSSNARINAITDAANTRMSEFEKHIQQLASKERELIATIDTQNKKIDKLEETMARKESEYYAVLRRGELCRSELHNRIQEMKGNIRVYARIRPLIPHDKEYTRDYDHRIEHYEFPDQVDHRSLRLNIPGTGKDYSFEFDKVFEPETSQGHVFEEISQLVQSALDGYKVCIFVYGQTGSGKTFTMEGGSDPQDLGMIPRAVEHVFRQSQNKKATGWVYTLRATFVEIYNDNIHDLLNPQDFRGQIAPGAPIKHEIRIIDNDTTITNIEEVNVEDASTVHQLLEISQANRRCESTLMNDRASRSHSVFTLKIRGVNEGTEQVQEGVLNLIDLAGSERVGKSGVEGDRFRETAYINKSLTSLGDVISALAKGDSHVPFRNSKLTHMLQPYMGGESKTLMFVNISPAESHMNESLCSLRFAAKVNACEIGLALRRVQSVSGLKHQQSMSNQKKEYS